jgi:hypothetical protein
MIVATFQNIGHHSHPLSVDDFAIVSALKTIANNTNTLDEANAKLRHYAPSSWYVYRGHDNIAVHRQKDDMVRVLLVTDAR